ncbi:MAG: YtxH domain-containing protein [Acidothermus sp.]|nr:YtxH domain-containing protein [Acidothermus sp.]
MRMRVGFVLGLGVGYILGTRAGRERYEQITRAAKKVFENPTVKQTAGKVQAQAVHLGSQARHMVQEKAGARLHELTEKMGDKLPGPLATRLMRRDHAMSVSSNGMPN